jgi:RNA 2',3'-cyclic 3'-phosphodiesterase
MKRLFFALWPDNITRRRCAAVMQSICLGNSKPVNPGNLHVTLLFLGKLALEQEIAVRQAAMTIPVPKISLRFDQLSFWKKPGVICLTSVELSEELTALVNNLTMLAKKLDIPIDERPFKPHVTLAKKARELTALEIEPIDWHCEAFCLVESKSSPNGVEYCIIEQWDAS